jgi:two-component system nitrogen regulation sensor histidine kinase NtrY
MAEKKLSSDRMILIAGAVFLASAVVVYAFIRWAKGSQLQQLVTDRVLLAFMMLAVGVLVLALVFVLLRNLVKLLVEWRREVLGSRFRTKLVFSFLILCLIPSVGLFYAAITIIEQTVEGLFTPEVEDLADLSQSVADAYNESREKEARRFSEQIAREARRRNLLVPRNLGRLEAHTRSSLNEYHLDFVAVFDAEGTPIHRLAVVPGGAKAYVTEEALTNIPARWIKRAVKGKQFSWLDPMIRGHRVTGIAPVLSLGGDGRVVGAVASGYYLEEKTANKTALISKITEDYLSLKANRREFKRVYIAFLLLLTLLILFSATWLGMYLARQITVPIQRLAEGTREIAGGNLDYRVDATAGDEIGVLIRSFNRMTEDLQRKEWQLEERSRYIETLLENVPAGVISLDPSGRVSTLNKAAYRLLGIEPSRDLWKLSVADAFSDPQLRPLVDLLKDATGAVGIHGTRELTITAGGRSVNLAASIASFHDPEGRSIGSLVVLEDLTLLIRAQKSAAWREAARRIAHEIKNPLTPIQLSAQRILKKYRESSGDLPQVLEEGTETIISEVNSLKAMVDEFSRFARIPPVSASPADPRAVIDSALSLYDGTRPGIQFERDYDGTPVQAMLDAEQIKRVLINLIDNAVEAMPDGGTITVATRHEAAAGIMRIEVSDDGPGIPPEDRDRLFLPHFSTKRRGTGLGLAICNRIVSDHGGTIRVEDNEPRGVRFIIEIPCAGERHASRETAGSG